MTQVFDRLFVGTVRDCMASSEEWSIVHACKSPCHQTAVAYRGSLRPEHPHYLILEQDGDLFLNLIDPPLPLFKEESFNTFLRFSHDAWLGGRKVLVHCNQGESRAPTLALLLMAKRLGALPRDTYTAAAAAFRSRYPRYTPGRGITAFMHDHWGEIQ